MDKMKITIKKDGTLKVETDQISGANHVSAERVLGAIQTLQGGETTSKVRANQTHTHTHDSDHAHDVEHQH